MAAVEVFNLVAKYPPKWSADIRNNGKLLAIFDFVQQERNRLYMYNSNKKELMYIQNIQGQKGSQETFVIDIMRLLK
jgi:hypothetical protein